MPHYYRISDLASTPKKRGKLPVSAATIWRWCKAGTFPAPFKLSANVTVWNSEEIDQFLAQRAGGH
ncbi:helix-turn-helix transcriptional regulator [Collimonas sp.]|uniref:helix-turn-helix transcriptional regulator n=1 Tax=Collimonas sp. TaxID=1963772 RepID=UPI002C7863AD|nr:AlpA family phage regulatory protein [Collimonas sp.]HWW06172.1 AlpA family phage regulatory protein [Collimonas sp.]